MASGQHKEIVRRVAPRHGARHEAGTRGPDIQTADPVIEVRLDPQRVAQELRQLVQSRRARNLAGPLDFVKAALAASRGNGAGVMTARGRIIKRGTRGVKK